jgi:SanA protein
MKTFKLLIRTCFWTAVAILLLIIVSNSIILLKSRKYLYKDVNEVPECHTVIVLGAMVSSSGTPSDYLQDRLDMAIGLYNSHKVSRFLLSGDHGQTTYDEVNAMKHYLLDHGIKTEDIFLDHAGFDTYSTMVRAGKVFLVKDVIIVSQEFHISRAVYIARSVGLNAYGIQADKQHYAGLRQLKIREVLARVKAFLEVTFHKKPRFLGNQIPITGDSKLSYD